MAGLRTVLRLVALGELRMVRDDVILDDHAVVEIPQMLGPEEGFMQQPRFRFQDGDLVEIDDLLYRIIAQDADATHLMSLGAGDGRLRSPHDEFWALYRRKDAPLRVRRGLLGNLPKPVTDNLDRPFEASIRVGRRRRCADRITSSSAIASSRRGTSATDASPCTPRVRADRGNRRPCSPYPTGET